MSRVPKICIGVTIDGVREACGDVINSGSRCDRHARLYESSRRGTSTQRYGAGYQARRAATLAPNADGSRKVCALRLPGCTYWADTADHRVPVSLGGRDSELDPACKHCNSSRGNRDVVNTSQDPRPGMYENSRDSRDSGVRGTIVMPDGSTREPGGDARLRTWKGNNH